jgi:hypothetical protein
MKANLPTEPKKGRRYFIGGSDAHTIMGDDEGALLRLWRENGGKPNRRISRETCWSS